MKLDSGTISTAAATELISRLDRRLLARHGEVRRTMRKVAGGELEFVETISDEEKAQAIVLFDFLGHVGPKLLLSKLRPLIASLIDIFERGDDLSGADTPIDDTLADADDDVAPTLSGLVGLDGHTQARLGLLTLSYIFYEDFHQPQAETGTYDIAGSAFEKVKWAYRYWFNQLEVAQDDSAVAEFFASQILDFPQHEVGDDTTVSTVSLSCGGDLLAVDVLIPENTPHLFDGIADFYSTADIVSANLESTVDERNPIGRHQSPGEPAQMNTSEAMFQRFRDNGKLNFFSTATNHSMDWGEDGVLATLDVLRTSGAAFAGTAAGEKEQDDVVVLERNGIKIALLSFTFDLNGHPLPDDKRFLVNEVRFNDAAPDFSLVERHVAAAKAKGAEYIVAYCHWGWEFEMYPHPNVIRHANQVIDLGVDTILGNHPHVPQPAQKVVRDGRPDGLITYAFGDFVSYHPESRNSKFSHVVKFDIVKEQGPNGSRVYLANLQCLPIYIVNAPRDDGSYDCRIVKFDDVYANPDDFGLTDLEKSQLPHLKDVVWGKILSPLSQIPR